jgi:homocitrate synthase NifV
MNPNITIEDTTLRDGEQMPGLSFDLETKLEIQRRLIDAGVRWIEAGIPSMGGEERHALARMLGEAGDAKLVAWNRGVRADIEDSIDMGFSVIHIGLPASDVLLTHSIGKDRTWLLRQARDLVHFAKDRGVFVSVSAEDVGRADPDFLVEYAGMVSEAGADRLRLSDTVGIMTPENYAKAVASIVSISDIAVQCHTHNDFGLGLANTMAGLAAGAKFFHVTVNGIGERAGLPDIAQATLALRHLYGIEVGIRSEKLVELSRYVAGKVGYALPPWTPLVGENAFAHESGIHVNAMMRNAATFEALSPDDVGGRRVFVLGKHSGRSALRSVLSAHQVRIDEERLSKCLEAVRDFAIEQRRAMTDEELVNLYQGTSNE